MHKAIRSQTASAVEDIARAWYPLRGARLFITGGSGFFGRWILHAIDLLNREMNYGISVVVLSRRPEQVRDEFAVYYSNEYFSLVGGDIRSFQFSDGNFDLLIHGAATSAHETFLGASSIDKFDLLVDGTRRVMDFIAETGVRRAVFLSSGVVYGPSSGHGPLTEDELNAPSTIHPDGGLAQGKRAAEFIFTERCRLCNLSSGNCIERCSRILASPLYICLCVSAPLFIDFDEDGANEPHERVFIREDPHFGCASF